VADLRNHRLDDVFDTVVSIGLLMFFDCQTAANALSELEAHLRPGGTIVVNVLVEGTTYMDMFDPQAFCLFERDALFRRYASWEILSAAHSDFPAPGGLIKSFATVIARKPSRTGVTEGLRS
jgi:tellurite methyltransferase